MKPENLEILGCPICKGKLAYRADKDELICHFHHLAFPIRDEVAILKVEEARRLTDEEKEKRQ